MKTITMTIEQYEKIKLLSRYSDYYLDDMEPSGEQYESDKEDITQAQEVLQEIDTNLAKEYTTPKFEPAEE